MILGDVGSNVTGVNDPPGSENREEGRRSQRRLASLEFEAAAFGHEARHPARRIRANPAQVGFTTDARIAMTQVSR
jgi:hypothetical protein